MTDHPAPVAGAIETLVTELEREHAWLADLKADAERTTRTCQRLMTAIDAGLATLPVAERRPLYARIKRLQVETRRIGRPPKDGRQRAVMEAIAERGEGVIRNADIRAHLERLGLDGNPAYVGNLLGSLVDDGMIFRTSHGCYEINATHPRLRALRMRATSREGQRAEPTM